MNSAVFEGLEDRNGHIRKEVYEGVNISWVGVQTKGEGCKCKLTKNMFFHSYLLQFCIQKKRKTIEFFPDTTVFLIIEKLALQTDGIKDRVILTNNITLYTCLTYVEPYQNIFEHFFMKIQF